MVAQDGMQTNSGGEHTLEVWARNLEEGFNMIRKLVSTHPYVAMVR